MTITNEQAAAIVGNGSYKDKVVKDAKAVLPEGGQVEGEITLRIPYCISKGFKTEIKPTASVLSQAVLAKALVYSGITAEAFKKALLQAAVEAQEDGKTIGQAVKHADKRVVAMIAQMDAVVNQMPKTPRAASVSVKVLTVDGLPEIVSSTIVVRNDVAQAA